MIHPLSYNRFWHSLVKIAAIKPPLLLLVGVLLWGLPAAVAQKDTMAIINRMPIIDSLILANIDSAYALSRITVKEAQEMDYAYGEIMATTKLVWTLKQRGAMQEARELGEQNLKDVTAYGNVGQIIAIQISLAEIYSHLSLHEEALKLNFESLELAEAGSDSVRVASLHVEIGTNYAQSGNNERALRYFTRAVELNDLLPVSQRNPMCYSNLGVATFMMKNDVAKARHYFDRSMETCLLQNNPRQAITVNTNIGTLYLQAQQFDSASAVLKLSLTMLGSNGTTHELMTINSNLASVYQSTNQLDSAVTYHKRAMKLGTKDQFRERSLHICRELAHTYENIGQKDSAITYYKKYAIEFDALFSEKTNNNLLRAEHQYKEDQLALENDNLKQKEAIALLQRDNEEAKASVANSQLRLVGLGSLVLLIVLFFILRSNRIRKTNNKNLLQKNEEIEEQKKVIEGSLLEKETLLREIHHRVKNNLQVVSSLLNLQSNSIQDEGTLKAVQEGQNRVKSMALIHKKLYQSEQLTSIDFQEYLEQLIDQISSSYGVSAGAVNVSAHQVLIDVDTAIPLGLIVNELVTNAIKYALQGAEESTVEVVLKQVEEASYELSVRDHGTGLPEDFNMGQSETLGLRLVHLLSKQVKAKLDYKNVGGAFFSLQFNHQLKNI